MKKIDPNIKKAKYQFNSFLKNCNIKSIKNKKLLEIGFKNGLFLNECQNNKARVFGTEVNSKHYFDTKSKYPALKLILTNGKRINLPDKYFDYIVSFQVLEHVEHIDSLMRECNRVLKNEGIIYHVCPNYHSFYEGHYKVVWFPFLTKDTGRIYLKLLGKYSNYYESLNIIKPKTLIREIKKYKNLKLVSLGQKEFISNFKPKQANKLDNKLLKSLFIFLYKSKWLKKMTLKLLLKAGLFYPIIIILKKNEKLR